MNFFKKEYECKNVIWKLIHRIIFNNIYRICFFIVILILGSLLPFDFSYYLWIIGAGGLAIHVLIFIIYAWIINPIKNLKERNSKKI